MLGVRSPAARMTLAKPEFVRKRGKRFVRRPPGRVGSADGEYSEAHALEREFIPLTRGAAAPALAPVLLPRLSGCLKARFCWLAW
jgi:hypothetical protein